MSYKEFPPMQAPETYNLDGILKAMQQAGHRSLWQADDVDAAGPKGPAADSSNSVA